jgi:hypothetical protein
MATILYYSSYGSDDPTRATLLFGAALGALEVGQTIAQSLPFYV